MCSGKSIRQQCLKRKFGMAKPLPSTSSQVFDVSRFSTAKFSKITQQEPEMRACKRIKLAPGSKLALKFPHLVQESITTKGNAFGGGTPGAASASSAVPGLLNIL